MNKEEVLELNEYLGSAYDLADEFNIQVFRVNTPEFNNKVLLYYFRQVKEIESLQQENQELKDRIKELELQNFNLKEDIMIKKMSLPSEEIKDKNFLDLYNMPTYDELKDRIDKADEYIESCLDGVYSLEPDYAPDFHFVDTLAKIQDLLKGDK